MNIFTRIFKIGQAEAHDAISKLEDPIKVTEQGIRDLKVDLEKALQSLAEVKAQQIRSSRELTAYQQRSTEYEQKAVLLLKRAESGELEITEADRLASEALRRKEHADKDAALHQREARRYDASVQQLENTVDTLKANITTWENELRTLKSRMKVSKATKTINKQLAGIDSSSTVSMLERMKARVEEEEALAESYGEIANQPTTVDAEIDRALDSGSNPSADERLLELKKRLGLPAATETDTIGAEDDSSENEKSSDN
ncbi:MAG: PspA/IM30 family protein [Bacteroidota bacterium]